jgi:hypothetical protein
MVDAPVFVGAIRESPFLYIFGTYPGITDITLNGVSMV